ncbi:MAG: DUF1801 domain-containing protein [Erysipelotrichaceae bacterium]
MKTFEDYLVSLKTKEQKDKITEIINWIDENYPQLEKRIAWNVPNYVYKNTFILGLSVSTKHISINPEPQTMMVYSDRIKNSGYSQTSNIFRILLSDKIDFPLIQQIIDYNILEKEGCNTYWR